MSLSPSDADITELLAESNTKEVKVTAELAVELAEDEAELLKSLEADLIDDELVGAKISQRLANIASKRWGITLPSDKLKPLLAKHVKPENCPDITMLRVNPEIWEQLNNFRCQADLRVSNIQQVLQKATFGILKVCDKLVTQQPRADKETLAANVDAIALLWHAVGELSRLRREQIKPALKPEFHSLCTQANESGSRSDLLFGADLAKQVRDAKDTNKIGKDIGVSKTGATRFSRPYNSHHDKRKPQKANGRYYRAGENKQPFLGKGQKKTHLLQEPNREDIIQSLENIKKSVSEFPSLVRDVKEYLNNRCTYFRTGCITKYISNWQMITSDKEILTSVRGATIKFDTLHAHNQLSLL